MNDQMEQVWRSKDGKCVGSKEEVEAYLATLSPLGKMRFPYTVGMELIYAEGESILGKELVALVAFGNLAPLFQPVIDSMNPSWREEYSWPELKKLLLAYEKALKLVPR